VAQSDLRPSGIADIGGQRVDVVSDGDFIVAGQPIEVVLDEGYRRVVRRVPARPDPTGGAAGPAGVGGRHQREEM
jgi:membrane-bound serine protease (ClpP class)